MDDLRIECLIRSLGIGANYRGYRYLSYGIKLCIYDEDYLLAIGKLLYPQIAKEYQATCSAETVHIFRRLLYIRFSSGQPLVNFLIFWSDT